MEPSTSSDRFRVDEEVEALMRASIRLHHQKERLAYFVCWFLLGNDLEDCREQSRAALAELGYDDDRIVGMLDKGEPPECAA